MGKTPYAKDSLGNRMKGYEDVYRSYLPKNMPVIIRLDGSHFHNYTKGMIKPFDEGLIQAFWETCEYLGEEVGGCKFIYHQSDEISLLIRNDDTFETQAWFKNNFQKLVSVTASLATAKFNEAIKKYYPDKKELATFDSRVFILPESEIVNYFIWRQQDCMRNAISMVAQSLFSHKSLQGQKKDKMIERMKEEKGLDFYNDIEIYKQRGACFENIEFDFEGAKRKRWEVNKEMPIIKESRELINKFKK